LDADLHEKADLNPKDFKPVLIMPFQSLFRLFCVQMPLKALKPLDAVYMKKLI
jgi:hypothetical protein